MPEVTLPHETTQHIEQQVATYHQKRLLRIALIFGALIGATLIGIGLVHLSLRRSHTAIFATKAALGVEHTRLGKVWRVCAMQAKKLKRLKLQKLSPCCAPLLTGIALSIPPKTLLTKATLEDAHLTLQGYADDTAELTTFMMRLVMQGHTDLQLSQSTPGPAGIAFVIKSCCPSK